MFDEQASADLCSGSESEQRPRFLSTAPPLGVAALLGTSRVMRELRDVVRRAAELDAVVLVLGETGTGKELIARAIHEESARRSLCSGKLTSVNVSAIPESLFEGEVFGHVRGAFTGADQDRPGLLEQPRGGTILLDEIGELSLTLQAKLLRVVEERCFRPLGARSDRPLLARLVCATLKDLHREVGHGRYRHDLVHRLDEVRIVAHPSATGSRTCRSTSATSRCAWAIPSWGFPQVASSCSPSWTGRVTCDRCGTSSRSF